MRHARFSLGFPTAFATLLLSSAATYADDDIPAKLAAVKSAFDGAAQVVVFDSTDITVVDSGLGASDQTRVVKVLTEDGIRPLSVLRWDFDPTTNQLDLKHVRIHRANGQTDDIDVSTAADQPDSAGIIFWGSRQLSINVPSLAVGDAVEFRRIKTGFNTAYLQDGEQGSATPSSLGGSAPSLKPQASSLGSASSLQPPMPGHWYDSVTWEEDIPVIEKRYVVRMPKNKPLQYEVVNGTLTSSVKVEGDHRVYRFEKKDIPPFKGEPQMCSRSDVTCKLVLATLEDWHAKARWFHEANEPSFKTDDAIKAKVRELVGDITDPEEKIRILNHWVAENIRYVGTSRGAHEGYTTHPAIETFHDRGGVCKDKAGMLVAMLREAGFDSYIVMTMAGSRVEQTAADQFNHAVTSIRNPDGTFRLLDPTWLPKNREQWSSAEQRQAVVFGTPEGESGLQLSAYSPPEDNRTEWVAQTNLLPDGSLRGSLRLTTVGCPETNFRRGLAGLRPELRRGRFEETLRQLSPSAALASLEFTDPVDFDGPAEARFDFTAPGACLGEDGARYLRLPALSGILFDQVLPDVLGSAPTDAAQRKHPVRIRSTRQLVCRESIQLPAGWTHQRLPEKAAIDGPAAAIDFKIDAADGAIAYEATVSLKKHIVPVAEYGNYKQVIDALKKLTEEMLILRKEVQSASR